MRWMLFYKIIMLDIIVFYHWLLVYENTLEKEWLFNFSCHFCVSIHPKCNHFLIRLLWERVRHIFAVEVWDWNFPDIWLLVFYVSYRASWCKTLDWMGLAREKQNGEKRFIRKCVLKKGGMKMGKSSCFCVVGKNRTNLLSIETMPIWLLIFIFIFFLFKVGMLWKFLMLILEYIG